MLELLDGGRPVAFSYAELLEHHGGTSPAGVAHAYKVLERALPLLGEGPPERRELTVHTAFGGPGARDAIERVTGAPPLVDPSLARPDRGRALERFVFVVGCHGRSVVLLAREGFVPDELIELARLQSRTPEEEARLDAVKRETAERVMAAPAADVYELAG
jgi:hypothetical protein